MSILFFGAAGAIPIDMALAVGKRPRVIGLESNDPTMYDPAHSGKGHSRKLMGQRWEITLKWPAMRRHEFQSVWTQLLKMQGRHIVTQQVLPEISTPAGVATGTPIATTTATGSFVPLTGFTLSTAVILAAGDMIKFAGHNKVYQVLNSPASDASGNATVEIYPSLVKAVGPAEAVIMRDVPFNLRRKSDRLKSEVKRGIYSITADFIEETL